MHPIWKVCDVDVETEAPSMRIVRALLEEAVLGRRQG